MKRLQYYVEQADKMMTNIRREFDMDYEQAQTIAFAEEAGEAVGAARRYMGLARRHGTKTELAEELADVIITALGMAVVFKIDIEEEIQQKFKTIFDRGWRE